MTPLKVSLALVISCWAAFVVIFVFFRPKVEKVAERKRDPVALWGFVLQGLAYVLVFAVRRAVLRPPVRMPVFVELIIAVVAPVLAVISVATAYWALRTLGKQWHFVARIVEGHRLVREGPYAYVRNPIYSAMMGLLIATGLIITNWFALIVAIVVFYLGTQIRVVREEALLRSEFGTQFEQYTRDVPALVPRFRR